MRKVQNNLTYAIVDEVDSILIDEARTPLIISGATDESSKFFGRSEYMTSVIFDGNDQEVGSVIKVKIKSSNQNTLFGISLNTLEKKVA